MPETGHLHPAVKPAPICLHASDPAPQSRDGVGVVRGRTARAEAMIRT
jgi:hypothetical protein